CGSSSDWNDREVTRLDHSQDTTSRSVDQPHAASGDVPSGRVAGRALLPPSPLRTARESFPITPPPLIPNFPPPLAHLLPLPWHGFVDGRRSVPTRDCRSCPFPLWPLVPCDAHAVLPR